MTLNGTGNLLIDGLHRPIAGQLSLTSILHRRENEGTPSRPGGEHGATKTERMHDPNEQPNEMQARLPAAERRSLPHGGPHC